MSHGVLVYDIEADGGPNSWDGMGEATKIHCIAATDHSGEVWVFVNDEHVDQIYHNFPDCHVAELSDFHELIHQYDALACHNQLWYDLPMLEKFIDLEYDMAPGKINGHRIQIIDTLVDSRWLYPDRPLARGCPTTILNPVTGKNDRIGPHGLMAWTYRTGGEKPVVHDWRDQPIEVYVERCIEDAKNNLLVFNWLNREMAEWWKTSKDPKHWRSTRSKAKLTIDTEQNFSHIIYKQQEHGVLFNSKKAEKSLPRLDKMMLDIRDETEPGLPEVPIPKSRLQKDWRFPAKFFKGDGEISSNGAKFLERHDATCYWDLKEKGNRLLCYDQIYEFPLPEFIRTTEKLQLYNLPEIKNYLIRHLNWVPVFWNYKIDQKTKVLLRDEDNELIPTTPRFKDKGTSQMCPNLMDIDHPVARNIIVFNSLKHRRDTIKSRKNNTSGYLNHPRLAVDGRLPATGNPCGAGTRRLTHRVVANIPKADDDVVFGKEMRSLFYCEPETHYIVGYDASGIEARLEGNEAYPYDKGEYSELLLEGDIHTFNADFFSSLVSQEISRGKAKGIKYALTYGAQAKKMSVMLGCSVEQAKDILEMYWEEYWAPKKAINKFTREWERNGKTCIKDITGGPLWIRAKHSIFNSRLQNAGTSVMKISAVLMHKWNRELIEEGQASKLIDYHDEAQWEVRKNLVKWKRVADEEEGKTYQDQGWSACRKINGKFYVAYCIVGERGIDSIREAGRILRIKVPLTGDYICGRSWADTH